MRHTQAYIICATPRSGTTLLCDLLADTGIAGRPDSFFGHQSIRWWAQYLDASVAEWSGDCGFDQSYLTAVHQEGAGGTQVFGMRLMWENVDYLSKRLGVLYPGLSSDSDRFRAAFGPIRFLHLSREDKVAQAVSGIKAEQTGLWHVNTDGTERERLKPEQALVYDARALSKQVAEYESHDAAWVNWFAQQNIQPLRITYKALSSSPRSTVATVLSALGLDPAVAGTVEPRTARLADNENREWTTHFRTMEVNHEPST